MDLEIVIGLEIHAQMNTKTKMFCRCDNDSFKKKPNTNVCPVCMGFPGQLPVLNKSALEKGVLAALALNCEIQHFSKFDRKHYFYPDNPKGFQISQFDKPLSQSGYVDITKEDGEIKRIKINRLHIEDDAGKLTHLDDGTLCDYNRSGTPLMEIVSESDMRSAKEARAYAEAVRNIVRFSGTSDCDMEKGMMRFDASVSMRPKGEDKLYERVEIKNLNSFRFLEDAINYEVDRQRKLWEAGTPNTILATAGWFADLGVTKILREKEEASDYRYFPEPDIPPMVLEADYIEGIKNSLPEMPYDKRTRYVEDMNLTIEDALVLTEEKGISDFFEKTAEISKNPKSSSNWILSTLLGYMRDTVTELKDVKVTPENLAEMITLIDDGDISGKIAKDVFDEMYKTGKNAKDIVEEKGLKQISDSGELEKICEAVLSEFASIVEDIRNGKDRAKGRLVGEVMKRTQGQANPKMVSDILDKHINI